MKQWVVDKYNTEVDVIIMIVTQFLNLFLQGRHRIRLPECVLAFDWENPVDGLSFSYSCTIHTYSHRITNIEEIVEMLLYREVTCLSR